jgi:hypothetical protein
LRASKFTQDQFQGVRWKDTDDDGYPDWFEWRNPAGNRSVSDINNPYIVPYTTPDDNYESDINYTQMDNKSGWYWDADPGLYNWDTAEDFIDKNGETLVDLGSGAGFPGIVLSIIAEERKIPLKIKLIEKSPKKINFLKD